MIEIVEGRPDGVLELKLTGMVSGEDYERVLEPALERALEDNDRIRALVQIGPGFEGYDTEAARDDARLGMKHWSGFDRMAVVTDVDWIDSMTKAVGFMMPCPVRSFDLDELDAARLWLHESLGSIHTRKLGPGALEVSLLGKLDPEVYDSARGDIDAAIADADDFRLLVDLRNFDGWQGLAGLRQHFDLVRHRYQLPSRIAVVVAHDWQKLAQRVMQAIAPGEVRAFDDDDYADARDWILSD